MLPFKHKIILPKNLKYQLDKRADEDNLRHLSNKTYATDFYSNDYLGYARSEEISRFIDTLSAHSTTPQLTRHGSTGSRLISGNHAYFDLIEDKAKTVFSAQAAVFYNSGYDANIGLLSAVLTSKDIVFYDELCHASIRDGLQMANSKAYKYKHCNYEHLEEQILRQSQRIEFENIYVVTESVFSMDGDTTDIQKLIGLKQQHDLKLIIDEAHAIGVCGKDFRGLTQEFSTQIFARIITCGKSLGSHGAFVLGSSDLKLFLINFSRVLIYSTGASPLHLRAVFAALTFFENDYTTKQQLQDVIVYFRQQVVRHGLDYHFINSTTAIQSIIIPGNINAKTIAQKLNDNHIGVKAILHPTVPKGKERLRICLHNFNTHKEIDVLFELIKVKL